MVDVRFDTKVWLTVCPQGSRNRNRPRENERERKFCREISISLRCETIAARFLLE